MAGMDADSVDLIVTDPPYFKVKSEWWDRQWDDEGKFLEWIGRLCEQWRRILRPNGSLYVFAAAQRGMARKVANVVEERFHILNEIRWYKEEGWHKKARVEDLRSNLEPWEGIIFAEHYGADGYAKGEAGYGAKCDELRGFVFEPLRAYLADEWTRAGLKFADANEACGTASMAARHFFSRSQWCLPTEEHYLSLRAYAHEHNHGGEYLRRDYEYLRRDYEYLRRDYEYLRRPFNATQDRPYTDIWNYETVSPVPGKHPCEKPVLLLEHIILTSSKPGAVVLDSCIGRGSTAEACIITGRDCIGIDIMEKWIGATERRIRELQAQPALPGMIGVEP